MNFFNPVFMQIVLDLLLFAAIIILLWRVNFGVKNPPLEPLREMTAELKSLIVESQANADRFLQAMEQSRLALKEIALELELKEKRVKSVLEKSRQEVQNTDTTRSNRAADFSRNKYSEVMNMINSGHTEEETARVTGFTQAEIGLIIDLSRINNESA
ncbi:MAG: hypothetical protein ABRQ29_09290 [Smithellaceae bacterium]